MEKNNIGIPPRHNYFKTFYLKRDPKAISTDFLKKGNLMIFLKLNSDKTNPNKLNKCIQLLDIF